jgi:polyhydroxyalkanoate synthesis repressor PhaR
MSVLGKMLQHNEDGPDAGAATRETLLSQANGSAEPIIIKKYANRRLYDTQASTYVTLEHLSKLVREGKEFQVLDAKSGEDLTRAVLAQIIFEQENRAEGVLPVSFLRQLIQFYGDNFQSMLPAYLEMSMKGFEQQQEKWRDYMATTLGDKDKAKAFDEQIRKNMEMFEEAVRLFTPAFPTAPRAEPHTNGAAPSEPQRPANPMASNPMAAGAEAIMAMQKQMLDMQKQLAALAASAYAPKSDKPE